MKILIAGVGNLLRGDDGFGVEVGRRLLTGNDLPSGVKVLEAGISGISLVQELMQGYNACIIIDAIKRNGSPGTLYLIKPEVPDLDSVGPEQHRDFLADMHFTEPSKALILAKALGVLPKKVLIIGCEPAIYDELGIGLSEPVGQAVARAVEEIAAVVKKLTGQTSEPSGEDA